MNEAYCRVSGIIREITHISECGQVVITPFNEIGMIAKSILENCYNYTPMIVDDELSNFNKNIATLKEYANIAEPSDIIILCVSDVDPNKEYVKQIKAAGIKARIKNYISKPIAYHSEKEAYFRQLKELLSVQKAVGFELKRIGRHHDGGYVLLDDFKECSIAYSFGINDDVSWDEQIAENDIDVFCYDHTINTLPVENPRLHFNKIGIGAKDSLGESLLSLDTILKLNNCQNQNRMILKMDVEGAEWEFVRDISSDTLSKFSQITFEFHSVVNFCVFNSEDILAVFRKLNQTHQIVWIHANNHGSVEQAGDIIIPDTIEVTYANRNQYKFQTCDYNCPIDIDEPNYYLIPDIELEFGSNVCEKNILDSKKSFFLNNTERKHDLREIRNIDLNDKCSLIESQKLNLNEQKAQIEAQLTKLTEQNSVIESQTAQINEQNSVIENQSIGLNEQKTIIRTLSAERDKQNSIIENQTARINQQDIELQSLLNSHSWRITAPLRKIAAFFKRLFKRR